MDPRIALESIVKAIEEQDWQKIRDITSPKFNCTGPAPEPLPKERLIEMYQHLHTAFPNLQLNLERVELIDPHKAHGWLSMRGTNTGPLNLSEYANRTLEPTGRDIELPADNVEVWLENDKITALIIDIPENGGMDGLLAQLGVEEPYSNE